MSPFYYLKSPRNTETPYLDELGKDGCPYLHALHWAGGALSHVEKDWLGKCLVKDVSQRWSIAKLLAHPYLADV